MLMVAGGLEYIHSTLVASNQPAEKSILSLVNEEIPRLQNGSPTGVTVSYVS